MVNGSRADLRRMDQEQNSQYKRMLAFVIFIIVSLTMITATFLNPFFMKGQIRTSNNRAVIVRQVNGHFDRLADLIGADREEDSNLLTIQQTEPIADHVIDYALGIHWVKVNNLNLAKQILNDINSNIDKGASSDAQVVSKKLKKLKSNAPFAVSRAFDLSVVTLGANICSLLFVVNVVIVIITVISLLSLISDMKSKSSLKALIHDITAAGMWSGFWIILIFGLLSIIPIFFNLESLLWGDVGYWLEIASSVFLDFVIIGVVMYVVCAIPWQATTPN